MKEVDYDSVGQIVPVTLLGGRYKIDIKAHQKNELVLRLSLLMTITTTMAKKQRNIN